MTYETDRLTPLRGRSSEVDLLHALAAAVRSNGRGRVVVVRGAAGSGKTRLLLEARSVAREAGMEVLSLGGDPDAQVIPHGPLLDGLRLGPSPLLSADVLAQLPSGPEQGYWLRNELEARLQEVALTQPVLVCVDDLQWCDGGTLRVVRTLPPRLATDAVVWIVAVRHEEAQPGVLATVQSLTQAGADVVDLRSLDENAVAEIAADLLGGVPDQGVLASAARAEGQPLLLVELLRGLLDEQLVRLEDGVARLVADELPARLRDAVGRRTARLSALAKDLLQVGAVLGRRFPVDVLAAVLEQPPAALLGPLQEVLDAGLLQDDGESLNFRHDLIREAVTANMPTGFARVLGRQAVESLLARGAPTVEVATMLAATALPGDLQAVESLRDAAKALALTSSPSAANFSVRALELLPEDSPLRPEVVVESIMLLWQGGRAGAAQELAATMLTDTMGIDATAEARIRLGLAIFLSRYSLTEAIHQGVTALRLPGISDELRIGLRMILAVGYGLTGEPDAAEAVLAPVRGILDNVPDPELQATLARVDSYAAFHRQNWDLAFRRHADVTVTATEELESPLALWEAAMWTSTGYPARAFALIDPAVASARRDGRVGSVVLWSSLRTRTLLDAGRLEETRAEAENLLDIEDIDVVGGVKDNLVVYALVRAALHAGWPDVIRFFRARIQQMTQDETAQIRRQGLWLTALIASHKGDDAAAMAATVDVAKVLDRPGPSFAVVDDLADAVVFVRMAMRSGERELAVRAVAMAERRAAANPGYTMAAAAAHHARALVSDDEDSLRQALHLYADTERTMVHASALEDLGRMVGPDRPREAVALLDEALDLCARAGAEHDAARIRGRLRKLGIRRRRSLLPPSSQHGLASLTPGEREVVVLVAEGGTNRQVAEQLFVSPHTVNTHLRNAFLKLNVRSRVELTRLVTEQAGPTR